MCLAAWSVQGEIRTWTGGGADANWSTTNNWGGVAPTTNDTLVFSGTTQLASHNDLAADTPIAGVVFSAGAGAFTLSGNPIALDGPVSNLSASAQTFSLGMALTGTRVFDASNGAITVNGALSGAGGLTKTGPQALTLAASNSYDGVTIVNNGLLSVSHGNALGNTNGNTEINGPSGGWLQISGSVTVPEAIFLNQQRPVGGDRHLLYIPSGSNTLSGYITCNASRIHSAAGTTLVFAGGVTNKAGYIVLNNPSGSTIAFYGNPIRSSGNRLYLEGTGLTILGVAGNIWTPMEIASTATLRTDVADAMPPASPLRFNATGGKLDLNGFDQTVSELYHLSLGVIQSTLPATLTVNQSTTSTYAGQLAGVVNLLKAGTGTLVLSNSLSATTGDITVTNGTLAVAIDNSLGNSTNVTVLGGTLELKTQYGIADTARLSISNGQVKIGAGLTERVGQLFLNGVQQMSGTWGSTASGAAHADDTHFPGTGTIYVLNSPPVSATDAIWDGEGADTFLSNTNNWREDALPAFNGTAYAIFGDGGSTATVDTAVSLHGMTFNRVGDFTLAGGDGTLALGAGGIMAASPDTASRTYTVAEDITLTENSTWHVATNGTGVTTLTVSGSTGDGPDAYSYSKTGAGTLILSGSNTYDGVTTVRDGALYITHPSALGSTNGMTEVDCMAGAHLNLRGGINVAEPFLVNGQRPLSKHSIYNENGSNTLSGPVMRKLGGVGFRIHLAYGTALIIRGGITGNGGGGWHIFSNSGGFLAVYDKPIVIAPSDVVFFEALGNMSILGVSGNIWGQTLINAAGTLRMGAVNALPTASTLWIQHNNTILDLNGFNQSVLSISEPSTGIITSAVPATLTVNQSTAATYRGLLKGAVSLFKAGTGTLTLSNNLSATTGDITVTNGTLAVALDNSLGNSTNITVAGAAARLELRTSSGIIDTATLKIANDGAKVNLLTGVNETVGWLYLGEKMQRAGTYSATSGGGVQVVDATHFSGTGVLTVLHDHCGTIVRLR